MISASVCVFVCLSVCPTGCLGNHSVIFTNFFVHVAYVHGPVLLQHVYEGRIAYRREAIFFRIDNALSPLLFVIIMEAIPREFRVALLWELLYADDLVVIAETEEDLIRGLMN